MGRRQGGQAVIWIALPPLIGGILMGAGLTLAGLALAFYLLTKENE